MPLYDYECKECGQVIEVFIKSAAPKECECKLCGGKMIRQLSTVAPPQFKGTGFYETDFKGKK